MLGTSIAHTASTAAQIASLRDELSTIATISGTLLGIGVALVAVLPTATALVADRIGRLEVALRSTMTLFLTGILLFSIGTFALTLLACLIGFLVGWSWLGTASIWLCIIGLLAFLSAGGGLSVHLRNVLH